VGTYSGNENDFQKYFTMISAKYKVLAIAAKLVILRSLLQNQQCF
jgi:hypothetical protein